MASIFLHGGGDDPHSRSTTFGRFVRALGDHGSAPLALVIAEATEADQQGSLEAYGAIFAELGVGADHIIPMFVSPTTPLTRPMLEQIQPCGVFVCGGATPFYQQALCHDPAWATYLADANIPYGGTSAGAAVAAQTAIVGGWQAQRGDIVRLMMFAGANEGLDLLAVRPGLGLVPFAVDVHAGQWGTLLRLIHAVDLELAPAGWAIDENTLLQIDEHGVQIYGSGHGYYVQRTPANKVHVSVHTGKA